MKNEVLHRNMPSEGYEGGLIFDEMTIQSDLQFHSKNGIKYLIEFTDILDESQFSREASDTGEFTWRFLSRDFRRKYWRDGRQRPQEFVAL